MLLQNSSNSNLPLQALQPNPNNNPNPHPLNQLHPDHPDHPTRLSSSAWGLPPEVVAWYASKGVKRLFPWQAEALAASSMVLAGHRNLVYSAPTSAGKTMVADILLLKTLLGTSGIGGRPGKKALIILPYVAIAAEKTASLKPLMRRIHRRIDCFAGNVNPRGGLDRVAVAVCTIEKANNMLNKLLEEGKLNDIGLIVVDEMHMIEDAHRGYLIELLLSKVLFHRRRQLQTLMQQQQQPNFNNFHAQSGNFFGPQIVGMSATIANLPELASWLDAELYVTSWRPVPLHQRIVNGLEVLETKKGASGQKMADDQLNQDSDDQEGEDKENTTVVVHSTLNLATFSLDAGATRPSSSIIDQQQAPLIHAALETLAGGHSTLVFCSTRRICEETALRIARQLHALITGKVPFSTMGTILRRQLSEVKILDLLGKLAKCWGQQGGFTTSSSSSSSTDQAEDVNQLKVLVKFGVAFHHAGLSAEERTLLEAAYRDGTLRVLVSTTTLSAGVNLPARRVLIWTPLKFNNTVQDVTTYRQMVGRAGRMGIDEVGEAMLFCRAGTSDYDLALRRLVFARLPPVRSALLSVSPTSHFGGAVGGGGGGGQFGLSQNVISQDAQQTQPQPTQLQQQANASSSHSNIRLSLSLKRAVLEVLNIADTSALGATAEDVRRYIAECTFFGTSNQGTAAASTASEQLLEAAVQAVVDFLLEKRFIYRENGSPTSSSHSSSSIGSCSESDSGLAAESTSSPPAAAEGSSSSSSSSTLARLHISLLGKAVVASGLSPDDAPFYQAELETASRRLCLINDLHLVYLLTPTYLAEQYAHRLDWTHYLNELFFKLLPPEERAIATELIGIEESYLWSRLAACGGSTVEPAKGTPASAKLMTHRRFYIALALYDLVREVPLAEVGRRYRLERATLQTLQQQAATFAGQLQIFAARLRWTNLELLFEAFQPRLNFGVQRELLELMRLPWLTVALARRLHEKGLATVAALASATPWTLEEALISTRRFEVRAKKGGSDATLDESFGAASGKDAATRLVEFIPADSAYLTVRELAKRLQSDSRALLGADLGVQERLMENFFAVEEEKEEQEADFYLDDDLVEELMVDISVDSSGL